MLDVIEPVGIDGLVRDWDALEALWSHAAKDYLAIDAAEQSTAQGESALEGLGGVRRGLRAKG